MSTSEVSSPTMTLDAAVWVKPHQRHGMSTVDGVAACLHDGAEELALPLGPAEVALGVGVARPHVARAFLPSRVWQPFFRSMWALASLMSRFTHTSTPPRLSTTPANPPKPIST